ncbi:MAG: glycosyltransferase family 4 protein [Gammaproteobacteria bacterium]|nr:glycosyltransferase family 4 protein [Sideroxydans sp.]MBU3903138.1 glycosyltransferase family 4 protein [Gammaproteobacteria bacterium]MBU4044847.1 glycosyltransferase family 4 protein [Gammaproteobacteria bacterium]
MLTDIRIARIATVPYTMVAHLKSQIAHIREQGSQVYAVASDEPEMAELEELDGVRCIPLDIPRAISPWRDLRAFIRLYRFFRRERIQIAHSTTPKAGLLTALAAFAAGVPVRLHTFTGQPWVTMRGVKRWLARASDKLIGKLNTRCYADSPSQRRFLISQGIVDEHKLTVVGAGSLAGVDVRRFDPDRFPAQQRGALRQSLGIPHGAPVLLFVGRITRDKGIDELLQAYSAIKQAGSEAHLLIVGNFDIGSGTGGAVSRGDIAQLPDTHLVDYTDDPESYYSIADILCLPSYREGFGTVVIEAAAMGVTMVGTNIYGLSDAVVDGETGLLVPVKDAGALAQAIGRLLSDKGLRAQLAEAARLRVLTLFDAERVNELVVREYADLLAAKRIKP